MRTQLLLGFVCIACFSASAQNFSNQANAQLLSVPVGNSLHGSGVSFFDFNQDGWDDLTIATENFGTYLYINNEGNYSLHEILPNEYECKAVVWGDYNNDGFPDLFVGSYLGQSQLWQQSAEGFENVADAAGIPSDSLAMTYGAAWGDYDRNGRLDLYICNYNEGTGPTNWLLRNNGNGTFTEAAENLGVANGVVWSFMPCWADFNKDGWPDLYVINDKAAPNAMFMNNGDGTFTDISEASNTDIVIDAMSNSITDFDNDGDLDIYVTNDFFGNVLYRNDGDFNFTEVTDVYNASVNSFCWGASWIDFDNDKDDDLFVCTANPMANTNPFYRMVIGDPLTPSNNVFSPPNSISSYSVAKGDYDRNGFPDLLHSNAPAGNVSLWRNNGGPNNWVGVSLQATVSNPGAVGSWVEVCSGGNCRVRYTHAGEAFMGQNSQHLLFGMGSDQAVDSVIVTWPSGHVDVLYSLGINAYHTIVEGESYEVVISGSTVLCETDSTTLSVQGYNFVTWSNGATTSSVTTDTAGTFQVSVLTSFGFLAESAPIEVLVENPPDFTIDLTPPSCFNSSDASILLSSPNIEEFIVSWNGMEGPPLLQGLSAGPIQIELLSSAGCTYLDSIEVTNPLPILVSVEQSDPLCADSANGSIAIEASGGSGDLTVTPSNFEENLTEGAYLFTISDENNCTLDTIVTCSPPEPLVIDLELVDAFESQEGSASVSVSGGTPPYTLLWSNGASNIPFQALFAGTYWLNVADAHGCNQMIEFEIDLITHIGERSTQEIVLYPNPSQGRFHARGIDFPFAFVLRDLQGRSVFQGTLESSPLDFFGLPAGCYHIELQNKHQFYRASLVIE